MSGKKSGGFSLIELILIVTMLGLLGLTGWYAYRQHRAPQGLPDNSGLTVVGNKIVEPDGGQYIPYGFVVWCLSDPDLSCNQHTSQYPNSDSDKIRAAASYWHANTVRIQVAYEHLFSGNGSVDPSYLQQLDSEVSLANSLGMVAIISQQTERYNGSLLPDAKSVTFWQYLSGHYKANLKVIFDLFNEPRLNQLKSNTVTEDKTWNLWQNGGTLASIDGTTVEYVGMQKLVDTVRAQGANNIIIAEGNHGDHDLSELPSHLLRGSNIAYGQEPDLTGPNPAYSFWLNNADETPAEWAANWGNLSDTYPIMMEAFQDHPGSFCYPNSPVILPQLLSYLQSKHLGMLFYSLDPGFATIGNNLTSPTSFSNGTFSCAGQAQPANTVGPGDSLLRWFTNNSAPIRS